jgi:hypothetical protein
MRIALVATCLADALFPDVVIATTRLLERLGHQVVFPAAQTCCGQMYPSCGITWTRSNRPTSTWRWRRPDRAWVPLGTSTR